MSVQQITLISLLLPVVAIIIIGIALYFDRNKVQDAKSQEHQQLKDKLPTRDKGINWNRYSLQAYKVLQEIPGIRKLLNRIYNRMGVVYVDNHIQMRSKSANYTSIILGLMLVIVIAAFLISDAWTTRIQVFVVALFAGGFMMDFFINNISTKLLREQERMLLKVRHEYHRTRVVHTSLEQVAEQYSENAIISAHASKVAEIMSAIDPEEELQDYYDVAPNRYMKDFAGISYKIYEYGDTPEDQDSIYLQSIANIREDLHIEITRRQKLKRLLAGLVTIAVVPIFCVDPIRRWGEGNFPIIAEYYNSSWGMYSLILLYLIFTVSYIVLRKAQSVETDPQGIRDEGKWLESALKKYPWLKKFILRIAPKENTYKHFLTEEGIKKANSRLSVEAFYLWKLFFLVVFTVGTIISQVGIHVQNKSNIMYPNENILVNKNSTDSQKTMAKERYAFESLLIGEIISKNLQPEEVVPYIIERSQNQPFLQLDTDWNTYGSSIASRVTKYESEYYKWYELLLAFAVGAMSFMIPNIYLGGKERSRRWQLQDEVDGYNTSVMMLSQMERISVYEILDWMHRDSYIFRDLLSDCLLNYEAGAYDALEVLKGEVNYEPMEHLIERLQEAAEQISVKKAFDDMKMQRDFTISDRKEHYEKVTSEKVAIARWAGCTPGIATLVIYLFVPFIYLMYQQLGDITKVTGTM